MFVKFLTDYDWHPLLDLRNGCPSYVAVVMAMTRCQSGVILGKSIEHLDFPTMFVSHWQRTGGFQFYQGLQAGIFLSNFQGGHLRFWTFSKKLISDLLKKLWTFQYAAGFRGPGILIKRSTLIVDLSVYAAWPRGPDISQNIQKIFKKYPKIDYRAFAHRIHTWAAIGTAYFSFAQHYF